MQHTGLRLLSGIMTLLFGAAAVVQYNDPDPVLWIGVYGTAALCSALSLAAWLPRWLAAAVSGISTIAAVYVLGQGLTSVGFFDPSGQEMLSVTEPGREAMGLLVVAAWLGWLALRAPRSSSPEGPEASLESRRGTKRDGEHRRE